MFVKLTKSGPRRYVQLAESYRDESGRTKQRTIASLGRVEKIERHFDSVIKGLHRVTGKSSPLPRSVAANKATSKPDVRFDASRAFGDVWALTSLWNELGFDQLKTVFRRR